MNGDLRKFHCPDSTVLGALCERLEHRLCMQDPVHPHQCIALGALPSSPHMLYQKSEFLKQRLLRMK